mgnify:CR=1 FL=1
MSDSSSDIRNRLLTTRLPAMPQLLLKLLQLCQDEDAGAAEFAQLIQQDPALAAKLLAISNSSAYARNGQKASLGQAVQLLGTQLIKTLVISESVFKVFNQFSHAGSARLGGFWQHSLHAAVAAELIARRIHYPRVEEAYLAGLLHDVGRLALYAVAPADYAPYIETVDDLALCASEAEQFQITHTDAGAWLMSRWNLDPLIADSCLYHHQDPDELETAHPLVRIVHLAQQLANPAVSEMALGFAAQICAVDEEMLGEIQTEIEPRLIRLAEDLGIHLEEALLDANQRLAEGVQQHVLNVQAAQGLQKPEEELGLLAAMSRAIRMIYPVENVCMLLADTLRLKAVSGDARVESLDEFEIPLSAKASRFVQVFTSGKAHWLLPDQSNFDVAELQLCRMLDVQALLIMPLSNGEISAGLLVAGFSSEQYPALTSRFSFLQAFVHEGATRFIKLRANLLSEQQRDGAQRQAQQLAARKLAHEVNNPLSIIKNYLGVLDSRISRFDPASEMLGIINEEIQRVGHLLQGYTEQAGRKELRQTALGRLVNDTVQLLRESAYCPGDVEIVVDLDEDLSELEVESGSLRQILLNLLRNAIEAMPQGGQVEIAAQSQVNRGGRLFYELQISDNGPGMPPEVLSKIFTPVKTAKGENHQGLGLSIVDDLVRSLGGEIACRSGRRGTRFDLLLPMNLCSVDSFEGN